jgi:hypothetical protein
MAPSATPQTTAPAPWIYNLTTLLFWFVFCAVIAGAVRWLAPRKGRSAWLALPALIPCGGLLVVLYLLCLPDKRLLDDIETLKKQTGKQSEPPPVPPLA